MTENTSAETDYVPGTDLAAEQPDAPDAAPGEDAADAETTVAEPNPNAEAKQWRLKFRAADTRAQIAEARVEAQNRRHAEQVLAKRLADPTDAWANGLDLDSVLDDSGLVDDEALLAYADELVDRKPHYAAKLRPVGTPASTVNGDGKIPGAATGLTWRDLLGGNTG